MTEQTHKWSQAVADGWAILDVLEDGVATISATGAIFRCNTAFRQLVGRDQLRTPELAAALRAQCVAGEKANAKWEEVKVVFPVHPRTRQRMAAAGLWTTVQLVEPLGYLDFLRLTSEARLVLTDSGGIQEETTILQVPCLTLRENTERPATITHGTNQLVGTDPENALRAAYAILDGPLVHRHGPDRWDGQAAKRVLDVLEPALCG